MKFLIIGGGEKPSKKLFDKYMEKAQYTIAIDSGLDVFLEFSVKPNFVLGDFDSTKIKKEIIESFNYISFPPEKDYTDGELALEKAIEFGAAEIYFLGMTGGRLDHFFGNVGLVKKALDRNVKAYIIDEKNILTMTDKSINLTDKFMKYISFYAYGGMVEKLNLTGCKYPLVNYNLMPFEGICNSNEFKDKEIKVEFVKGTLIIIYSQD